MADFKLVQNLCKESSFYFFDNVLTIQLINNTYYKFAIKKGLRNHAYLKIKNSINSFSVDENKDYKNKTNKLAKNIINTRNLILKYFLFSNCNKCDSTRFIINDMYFRIT